MILLVKQSWKKPYVNYRGRYTLFKSHIGIEKVVYLNHLFGIESIYRIVLYKENSTANPRVVTIEIYNQENFIKVNPKDSIWKSNLRLFIIQIFIIWYAGFKVSDTNVGYYNGRPTILLHKLKYGDGKRNFHEVNYYSIFTDFKNIVQSLVLQIGKALSIQFTDVYKYMSYNPSVYRYLLRQQKVINTGKSSIYSYLHLYINSITSKTIKSSLIFISTFNKLIPEQYDYIIENLKDIQIIIDTHQGIEIKIPNLGYKHISVFDIFAYELLYDLGNLSFRNTWLSIAIKLDPMNVYNSKLYDLSV